MEQKGIASLMSSPPGSDYAAPRYVPDLGFSFSSLCLSSSLQGLSPSFIPGVSQGSFSKYASYSLPDFSSNPLYLIFLPFII